MCVSVFSLNIITRKPITLAIQLIYSDYGGQHNTVYNDGGRGGRSDRMSLAFRIWNVLLWGVPSSRFQRLSYVTGKDGSFSGKDWKEICRGIGEELRVTLLTVSG